MVIDDLANRTHDCDLLLDQNLGRTLEDYQPHLPHTANTLIGPRYALLRPAFSALREESLSRRNPPQLKQLLITLGGVDQDNYTEQVLNALRHCPLPSDLHITVVMGAHAPWLEKIKATALSMPCPIQVLVNVPHMARWMTVSDLCIGASGGTTWERCSLGLPSFVIATADNQQAGALALEKLGAARIFKSASELIELIKKLLPPNEPATLLKQLSMAAAQVTTGNGTALVIDQMRGLHA
jgi:UDP-2,4-diacetamido-2,4,6-trideoxy-beta-L-altropyranose hydrolase